MGVKENNGLGRGGLWSQWGIRAFLATQGQVWGRKSHNEHIDCIESFG